MPNAPSAYRHVEVREKPAPNATFAMEWNDTERRTRWPAVSIGATSVVLLTYAVGMAYPAMAWPAFVGGVVGMVIRFRRRSTDPIRFEVDGGRLHIEQDGSPPRSLRLDAIREIELDRKAIRRLTYHHDVGAVMPRDNLSDEVDVARIAFVRDDEDAPMLLTHSYASYGECAERFGKLRKFLRSHGWLPIGERLPDDEEDDDDDDEEEVP